MPSAVDEAAVVEVEDSEAAGAVVGVIEAAAGFRGWAAVEEEA